MKKFLFLFCFLFSALHASRSAPERVVSTPDQIAQAKKIQHIIIIFQENWSFDSLYGKFPNVNGLSNAKPEAFRQIDPFGKPYSLLLTCINTDTKTPYPKIPNNLPNAPFNLQPFLPMNQKTGDLVHEFYQEIFQINDGAMNRFALWSDAGGFVMSYYDISLTRMGTLSKQFVICDNWFHSCYGGSMCGALWLFTAQMPLWPNASQELVCKILPSGMMTKNGIVSPDGFVVNDAQPFYCPYKPNTPDNRRVPPQTYKTIGDLLSEKNVSWKWYAEGWNNAINDKADKTFEFHHQSPVYFSQFAPGTQARADHLFDIDQFYLDLDKGTLPAVCFVRSLDHFSQHPGNGALLDGLNWCADLIEKIQKSSSWKDCAIILTYDENGGRWDHVSPPVVDRFGPGTRVPALIISPFARKSYIDHTSYETVSILKFIEERFDLPSLSTRDGAANSILNAFDFSGN